MYRHASAAPGAENPGVSFAGFRLEPDGTLLRGTTPIHLPPKELAALRLLVENAGRVITPHELREALWGEVHVTEDSVSKCMSSLRAYLQPEDCIQTVYKRGYRFTPGVRKHGAGPGGWLPRLMILPFATGYGVPEHLGPALAEETMARLSNTRPPVVNVLAQDSVFTLARRGMTAQQTGEALGADLVLAGALSMLPMHYRLRVEMIRVEDGVQIWVEDLLVERSRIAGLETELGRRLAFRLGGAELTLLSGVQRGAVTETPSLPPTAAEGLTISAVAALGEDDGRERREAYEIFQRARHEWQSLQRHRMQDALQHLLHATELDPGLLGARIDLVYLCVAQCFYGFMPAATAVDIVRRATASIADLPARATSILPALGWISFHCDRDLPAALRSMALSAWLPHDPWVTRMRITLALSRHRFGEAIDLLRSVIPVDPYSPWLQAQLAWALHLAGESRDSVEQIRRALHQFPGNESASLYGAIILTYNGETQAAVELAHDLVQQHPYLDMAASVHAYTLARAGRRDEAQAILERLQWLSRERFLLKAFLPAAYLALGQPEIALAELRAGDAMRCPWLFQMLADPRLKELEGRAEFRALRGILSRMESEAAGDDELSA